MHGIGLAFTALILSCASMAQAGDFRLRSPDFEDGKTLPDKHVFNGFGCHGQNLSPALNWENPPLGAKSFALTVFDPDAPTGHGWSSTSRPAWLAWPREWATPGARACPPGPDSRARTLAPRATAELAPRQGISPTAISSPSTRSMPPTWTLTPLPRQPRSGPK